MRSLVDDLAGLMNRQIRQTLAGAGELGLSFRDGGNAALVAVLFVCIPQDPQEYAAALSQRRRKAACTSAASSLGRSVGYTHRHYGPGGNSANS